MLTEPDVVEKEILFKQFLEKAMSPAAKDNPPEIKQVFTKEVSQQIVLEPIVDLLPTEMFTILAKEETIKLDTNVVTDVTTERISQTSPSPMSNIDKRIEDRKTSIQIQLKQMDVASVVDDY